MKKAVCGSAEKTIGHHFEFERSVQKFGTLCTVYSGLHQENTEEASLL